MAAVVEVVASPISAGAEDDVLEDFVPPVAAVVAVLDFLRELEGRLLIVLTRYDNSQ